MRNNRCNLHQRELKSRAPIKAERREARHVYRFCGTNNPSSIGAAWKNRFSYAASKEELVRIGSLFCYKHDAPNGAPGKSPFFPSQAVLNSSVFPMSSKPKPREAEPNFEGAMDRLEKIVEQMESGKLPLEDLIVRYEEGMKLVKICQERLANAEQKIEIITRNSAGKPVVQEFEPAQEAGPPDKTAVESESTDDEIKLF
jgi:exodeoxyribonuclease VII small subunit